jgi:hypothetical protein
MTSLFCLHCLYNKNRVVRRKIKASEQAMPIPAFAPGEREDLLGVGEVVWLVWALFWEDALVGFVAGFVLVLVPAPAEFVGVGVGVDVLLLLLSTGSAVEVELNVFDEVVEVLGFWMTGACVCEGFEGETDDVDEEPEPAACMLKTRP